MPQLQTRPPRDVICFWGVVGFAVVAGWVVYQPGLSGTFLFDDYANLSALGAYGPIDNWSTFLRYLTSGIADPTGRPLAMLTFLFDAQDWPADPFPFKRTNVLLHLANGLLLALALRKLGTIAQISDERTVNLAASLGAAFWLLHPLWVSTTLYIVQREAMLPVTFTLLGLLGFCAGSSLATRGKRGGVWIAGLSVTVATVLACLCKANGVLLPLLVWLTDALLIAPHRTLLDAGGSVRFVWMRRIVLQIPTVLLVLWLAVDGAAYFAQGILPIRGWTIGQRLLTESRVVCDYLHLLWLPRPYTAGLFNDGVTVSQGLFSPPTTFVSIIFLSALLIFATGVRKRAPTLAFAIFFFAVGHLLESTVIPLELYYEHRNYLPAMFLFWPVTLWLSSRTKLVRVVRGLLMVLIPATLASMTYQASTLWGDAGQQAEVWATKNPESPRAQAYAAQIELSRGRTDLAIARLQAARVPEDEDIQIALNLLGAECEIDRVQASDLDRTDRALRTARITGQLGYEWFTDAIDKFASQHTCHGLDAHVMLRLIDAADANPNSEKMPSRAQDNASLRGQLALAQGDATTALRYFKQALDISPKPESGLTSTARLASTGHPIEALAMLDHLEKVWKPDAARGVSMSALHTRLLFHQGYWQNEISHLRSTITTDIDDAQAKNLPPG